MPSDLRDVGVDFFSTAPYRCSTTEQLGHPAAEVFDALTRDPAGWGDWNPGFSRSGRWLTPAPQGAGSVREVRMVGIRYTGKVIVWEEPTRWAFHVATAGVPLARALAEDYAIVPDGERCSLRWTIAMDPHPLLGATRPLMDAFLPRYFRRAAANLDRYLQRAR